MLGLMPTTVLAAGMQAGTPTFTLSSGNNTSTVAFAGHKWWVIGYNEKGVHPVANTVTLLAKDDDFGTSAFRTGSLSPFENSKASTHNSVTYYFAGTSWTRPHEYAGSTLQQKMVEIANGFDSRESALIKARNLTSANYYMRGPAVANQKLWPLSATESSNIGNDTVRSYGSRWWLCSYGTNWDIWDLSIGLDDGRDVYGTGYAYEIFAVRPALNLDLTSVLFTSAASETSGKASAAAGGNLVDVKAPTGTVKFTVKDTANQKLTVEAAEAQKRQSGATLTFAYSNATTGTNQYISCVLTDSTGAMKYYGKLKNCADSSAAKGAISVPLSDITDGTYTLKIFSEQANDDKYTDFASEPVTMTVTVSGGTGTVSGYAGSGHTHDYEYEYTYENDTQHKGVCYCGDSTLQDHSGGTATCTSAKVCTVCNEAYGSVDADNHAWGDWSKLSETQHQRVCGNDESHIETDSHSGGTATCTSAEVLCTVCNQSYISVDADNHAWGDWSEISETQHQRICGNDESHTDTAAHSYDNAADMICNDCGYERTPAPTDDELDDVPDTGDDSSIGLFIGIMMIAAAGIVLCAVMYRRKQTR